MASKYTICIDTREQKPYRFDNSTSIKVKYGDYTIERFEHLIGIERKTLTDWISSVTRNREEMEKKIKQCKGRLLYYAIVIESDLPRMWKGIRYSKVPPQVYINTAIRWSVKHNIPIFFASTRTQGQYIIKMLLDSFFTYYMERINNSK